MNGCNIYLLLWCLCELKGTLYAPGSIISQGLMLIIVLISAKEFLFYYQKPSVKTSASRAYFKSVLLLLILYTVYGIALFLTDGFVYGDRPTYYYLQAAYITFLPVYTCYIFTKQGKLTLTSLQLWMVVFIVVGICQFYYTQQKMMTQIIENGSYIDETTNNAGYILLSIMPGLLVYYKKPIYMYLGLGICVFFVLVSMKRGAILIAAFILCQIIYRQIKKSKGSIKIFSLLLGTIGTILLVAFVMNLANTDDFFYLRIQETLEGNTSDRDVIYKNLWDIYKDQFGFFEKIVGVGGMGTLKRVGMYAHNDWLETVFDQGILGIVVLVNYVLVFYKTVMNRKFSDLSKFCLLLTFQIFLIKSFFSMSICGMSIFMATVLGFALADGFSQYTNVVKYRNTYDI